MERVINSSMSLEEIREPIIVGYWKDDNTELDEFHMLVSNEHEPHPALKIWGFELIENILDGAPISQFEYETHSHQETIQLAMDDGYKLFVYSNIYGLIRG